MCIATYQPGTKSNANLNPNPNPTTKQHMIVNIQLNIVTSSYAIKLLSYVEPGVTGRSIYPRPKYTLGYCLVFTSIKIRPTSRVAANPKPNPNPLRVTVLVEDLRVCPSVLHA